MIYSIFTSEKERNGLKCHTRLAMQKIEIIPPKLKSVLFKFRMSNINVV